MDELLKVVFDTPIYLRGLLNPHSSYGLLFTKWTKAYLIYITGAIEADIVRVLSAHSLYSKLSPITDTQMNVVQYMRVRHNLLIGEHSAEKVLMELKPDSPLDGVTTVKGRNLITGLPHAVEASSNEIREALSSALDNSRLGNLIAGSVYQKFRYAQQVHLTPEEIVQIGDNGSHAFLLACVKKANADYLVTEDNDLIKMKLHHATQIVDVAAFLAVLEARQSSKTGQSEA